MSKVSKWSQFVVALESHFGARICLVCELGINVERNRAARVRKRPIKICIGRQRPAACAISVYSFEFGVPGSFRNTQAGLSYFEIRAPERALRIVMPSNVFNAQLFPI